MAAALLMEKHLECDVHRSKTSVKEWLRWDPPAQGFGSALQRAAVRPGTRCWSCGARGHWKTECSYRGAWKVEIEERTVECVSIESLKPKSIHEANEDVLYKIGNDDEIMVGSWLF